MSGIFIVLIIVVLIVIAVFFEVMVKIGAAGVSPSKLMSDIVKKKRDEIELSDKVQVDNTIQRWRLIAGILFSIVMLYLLVFWSALVSGFFPWAHYIFWPLLIATVIVFIILRNKEQNINTADRCAPADFFVQPKEDEKSCLKKNGTTINSFGKTWAISKKGDPT